MGEPVGSAHDPVGLRHGELEGGRDGRNLAGRHVLDVGDPALEEDLLPSFSREIEDVPLKVIVSLFDYLEVGLRVTGRSLGRMDVDVFCNVRPEQGLEEQIWARGLWMTLVGQGLQTDRVALGGSVDQTEAALGLGSVQGQLVRLEEQVLGDEGLYHALDLVGVLVSEVYD